MTSQASHVTSQASHMTSQASHMTSQAIHLGVVGSDMSYDICDSGSRQDKVLCCTTDVSLAGVRDKGVGQGEAVLLKGLEK